MAKKRELEQVIVRVGSTAWSTMQPLNEYKDISAIVGVNKAPADAVSEVHTTVRELQRAGKVIRISCRMSDGKYNGILCAIDKVASALGSLRGKTIGDRTIKSVTIPRKRSRR